MEFRTALRETMTELGLKSIDVAASGNVSESMVGRYLSGLRKPSYDTLSRLRQAYPTLAKRIDAVASVA